MTNQEIQPALTACLQELHLPTMRSQFQELAQRAQQETLSYESYLLELAERECQQRRQNRIERLLKESRLPLEKNLQTYDLKRFADQNGATNTHVVDGGLRAASGECVAFRSPGQWQDAWLLRIAQELVRVGQRVLFTTCNLLVQELLVAKRDLTLKGVAAASGELGRIAHRRPRLCATESRGDGGALHALGGALRDGQRDGDEQSCVHEMGKGVQRP